MEEGNSVYDSRNDCNAIIETSTNTLILGCSTTIIPESVTSIGDYAFHGCSGLTSITIPESVTSIGNSAFSDCSGLTSITIPEGVASIEINAFYGCRCLISITIPKSVTSIGDCAFSECHSLISITIPENVTSIGDGAFWNCDSLSSITCKAKTPPTIDSYTFGYTKESIRIYVPSSAVFAYQSAEYWSEFANIIPSDICGENLTWEFTDMGSLIIEGIGAMYDYSPNDIPWFEHREEINSVVLEKGITSIGNNAFSICSNLTSIIIPEGVASIGENAFNGCRKLSSISIPSSVTSIGDGAFYWCSNLSSIEVAKGNSIYDSRSDCNAIVETNSNTMIVGCYSSVIAETVTCIGIGAFCGCTNLSSITIPKSVTNIKNGAFQGCDKLTTITIPENVTEIGDQAFQRCSGLISITCEAVTPPSVAYSSTFSNVNRSIPIYVLASSVSAYRTAKIWSAFTNIQPIVYLLTYMVDGEVVLIDTVAYGAEINPLDEPTKVGYSFSGWSEMPKIMPANDITTYGTFTINKYLVNFKIGDEVIAADSLEYGATIVAPEVSEKEGYTFNGWGDVAETVPANDLTYEGSYSVNSYLLTYTVGGETVQTDSVAYGTAITLLEEPTKEGYTFSGWSEAPETMPANDVTISGTFTVNKYLVTFKIGDEVIATDSLEYGIAIVAPEAPEKEGYTFNGWGEVAEAVPANDLTYEGSYSVNSYLLTYTVDGETVQSDSIAYGTEIILLDEPTKEGYTFSGWSEAPETMPTEDVIISGTFTVNKYLTIFMIDGVVMATDSLEYGTGIVAPSVPDREGYTFNGWGEVAETVPAEDVTYTGYYTVNIYKVYYFVGSMLVHIAEVAYCEAIPEYIYEPTKEGDIFEGWVGDTYETMPAHDVTYTANIESGIEDTEFKIQNSEFIYDLMGRKVTDTENLKGGIYIVNGRKVVIDVER